MNTTIIIDNNNNNHTEKPINDARWEKLLSTLSPNKITALEKSLKEYQKKLTHEMPLDDVNNNQMDVGLPFFIKSEPITTTNTYINSHKTKNRGLTYENGRRNLKSEDCALDEMERRAKRRERNRLAAAKCREKRQSQLDELQGQVYQLRERETQLHSVLMNLKNEEHHIRSKLSNMNCIVAENQNGDLSLMISRSNNGITNKSVTSNRTNNNNYQSSLVSNNCNTNCRPKSLPLDCNNCTLTSTNTKPISDNANSTNYDCYDKTPSLDQLFSKDDSFTPLLSPDTYTLLKGQMKTEPEETDTPTHSVDTIPATLTPLNNVKGSSVLYNPTPQKSMYPMVSEQNNIHSNSNNNNNDVVFTHPQQVFSWNNNVVDNLSQNCYNSSNQSNVITTSSNNYLTTPTVDLPCYGVPQNNYY